MMLMIVAFDDSENQVKNDAHDDDDDVDDDDGCRGGVGHDDSDLALRIGC